MVRVITDARPRRRFSHQEVDMLRRFAFVGLLLLLSRPVFAQQGTSDIRGKVVDQQGGVLPGVTVVLRHQESGLFRETVTGEDGAFLMSGMTPGVYEISAELTGFKRYSQRDVRLEVGRTAQVELNMEVGGLTEAVTVSAEAPLVDTSSQEIGGASARRSSSIRRHSIATSPDTSACCPVWWRRSPRRPSAPTRSASPGRTSAT
jgi:hypothetical protein